MSVDRIPVLTLGDVLLVSIQVDLEDQLALRLQDDLAERIVATGARGVIIDITALDIVDSFVGRTLATIASVSKVLDAETIVVGCARPSPSPSSSSGSSCPGCAPRSTSSSPWACWRRPGWPNPARGT